MAAAPVKVEIGAAEVRLGLHACDEALVMGQAVDDETAAALVAQVEAAGVLVGATGELDHPVGEDGATEELGHAAGEEGATGVEGADDAPQPVELDED